MVSKALGQAHKSGVMVDILFLALLIQVPYGKYHANSYTALLEATLTLQQQIMFKVCQIVQQDPGQDFPCGRKHRDVSVVITDLSFSFSFAQVKNCYL